MPRKGYRLALPVARLDVDTRHDSTLVLPFQNLSARGPHAYFAGGLHDQGAVAEAQTNFNPE